MPKEKFIASIPQADMLKKENLIIHLNNLKKKSNLLLVIKDMK